jgi:hypothetical protein
MNAPTPIVGRRTRKNNRNVYVLGAGFSIDAGLPTIANFLNHMRDAADWLAVNHCDNERTAVERVLEFRHSAAAAGYRINVDLDNIEDLFSLAAALPEQDLRRDMQAAIGATLNYSQRRGSPREVRLRLKPHQSWPMTEQWRERASRIAASDDSHDVFCSVYDYYAALLAGRASSIDAGENIVLTFNYDLVLEDSLTALGIPYSYGLGTNGVKYDAASPCLPDARSDALTILKLHGSLNWRLSESTPASCTYPGLTMTWWRRKGFRTSYLRPGTRLYQHRCGASGPRPWRRSGRPLASSSLGFPFESWMLISSICWLLV